MAKAIFAGSFDPFTYGHLYIVKVASKIFDSLTICIATNVDKTRTFTKEFMKEGIEETLRDENITNCDVVCYDGLIVDLAKQIDAQFVVRGIRDASVVEYEQEVAKTYFLTGGIETVYLGSGTYAGVQPGTSSTIVRNLLKENKDISQYVPKSIERRILNK